MNTSSGKPKDSADKALKNIPPDRYQQQYGVIVICKGEEHQRKIYERLRGQGLKCKVVVT